MHEVIVGLVKSVKKDCAMPDCSEPGVCPFHGAEGLLYTCKAHPDRIAQWCGLCTQGGPTEAACADCLCTYCGEVHESDHWCIEKSDAAHEADLLQRDEARHGR